MYIYYLAEWQKLSCVKSDARPTGRRGKHAGRHQSASHVASHQSAAYCNSIGNENLGDELKNESRGSVFESLCAAVVAALSHFFVYANFHPCPRASESD